jgi:putative phage-type endonuclease
MKRLAFAQGTPEWHAHRATARNASDAPAMLGCSPYMTRGELLHARYTGLRAEPDAALARRYADGHAIETAQRETAAALIGEPLYPMVGSEVIDGMELSASFDGLTMAEDVAYECKTLNDDLRAVLLYESDAANAGRYTALPKHYRVQMEQQLMVCGGERVLFVAATKDGSDVRRCWYYPDAALRAEILAGWRQFDADLAAYIPPAAAAVIVAEPVQSLPAVSVIVSGEIAIRDNFAAFEVALRDFLEHRLIREPKTDQDFADLDVQIKAMKGAEAALESAEAQMLAQIQTVDQAKKTKDMLGKLVRDNRLMAEKLLTSEKERRRGEIVAGAVGALQAHVAALNKRLGKPYMPQVPADFGGAIKGLKSLASMEDKVATVLANAKIEANATADRIDANLRQLREQAAEVPHLFPDTATLVLRTPDDCALIVQARITEHKAAEERRLEAERARIRAEEEARAQRQQQEREAAERRQREEAEALQRRQEQEAALRASLERQQQEAADAAQRRQEAPAAGPAVIPMPTRAPTAPASAPALRLGEIQKRIAPVSIDAAGLTALGFPPAKQEGAAKLYHEADFPRICAALISHLTTARDQLVKAA